MYIINGICYAGKLDEGIEVTDVKPLDDMMMLITFNSGEVRLFDATILKGSAFKDLEDKDIFVNAKIDDGVVTWKNGEIDCAPEYMYKNSYKYEKVAG